MATAEQIKALVHSYGESDDARFYSVAMQVAANEAKKGNVEFASTLKALIERAKQRGHSDLQVGRPVSIAAPRGELADLLTAYYPQTRLGDMVLAPKLSIRLHRIIEEQRHLDRLKAHDLHPRQRLLLVGPPGCGKTMTASALAGELGLPLLVVRLEGLITKFMGETSAKLRLVFDAVEQTRAVYLFDEFDSIGTERGRGSDVGEIRRILNSFLMFMERQTGASLLIAATNHAHALDAALFRRFDDLIEFTLPSGELVVRTLKRRLVKVRLEGRISWTQVARSATGMSYAEIVKACNEAVKQMLLNNREILTKKELIGALEERRTFLKRGKMPSA
jgi:AAA+ superfamily predicted ATPase